MLPRCFRYLNCASNFLIKSVRAPANCPIAAPHRHCNDARVTKNETPVRRGKQWFRYDAPDKQLFKQLQKTLTAPD